ncbi:MAG: YIP1 family protein [Cyclobacteriaceae bacterium]
MNQQFLLTLFKPKTTFPKLIVATKSWPFNLTLVIAAISIAFSQAQKTGLGDGKSIFEVITYTVIGGATICYLFLLIYIKLIHWTGKLFKAEGEFKTIYKVFATATLPLAFRTLSFCILILLFGNDIFQSHFNVAFLSNSEALIYQAFVALDFILIIWTLVLIIIGLSIVQEFSIIKSIFNYLLPAVILMTVLMAIAVTGNILQ